jgi:hypothetical protein
VTVQAWAGEPDVLDDLGVSGRTLRKLVEENGEDPARSSRRSARRWASPRCSKRCVDVEAA